MAENPNPFDTEFGPSGSAQDLGALIRKIQESPYDKNNVYRISLSVEEIKMLDQMAFNYHQFAGRKMRLPPSLASDLKRLGCSDKHWEIDPGLEMPGLSDSGPKG